jgi:YHS domain-containing protein
MVALAVAPFPITVSADEASHTIEQTICPVMEGNPIKQSIYVRHEGERVYFCCEFCKGEFLKAPAKYLDKLPQFSAENTPTATAHTHVNHLDESATGWRLYRLTAPLGVVTFALLMLTLCTGLLRRRLKRRFLPIHRPLAIATVTVATLHVVTVLLGH